MAVAKKCDRCGKYYEGNIENTYSYEENGKTFYVDSIRLGKWNARTKSWDNIVSGYDLCRECGKEIAQVVLGGDKNELVTHTPIKPVKRKEIDNDSDSNI
jgi:hypothetical protein